MRLELQADGGDTNVVLFQPHGLDLRRRPEHGLPLHAARARRRRRLGEPARSRSARASRRSKKRSRTSRSTRTSSARRRRTSPASRPTRRGLAEGTGEPARRRRALVGRRSRRAAARRDLLLAQHLSGDRTGRDRNLVRPGGKLGLRNLPAAGREDRRTAPRHRRDDHCACEPSPPGTSAKRRRSARDGDRARDHLGARARNALVLRRRQAVRRLGGHAEGGHQRQHRANELPTALGTLLSFERAGVSYVLVGRAAALRRRSGGARALGSGQRRACPMGRV